MSTVIYKEILVVISAPSELPCSSGEQSLLFQQLKKKKKKTQKTLKVWIPLFETNFDVNERILTSSLFSIAVKYIAVDSLKALPQSPKLTSSSAQALN